MIIGQTIQATNFPAISPLTKYRNSPISTVKTIYATNDFLVIANGYFLLLFINSPVIFAATITTQWSYCRYLFFSVSLLNVDLALHKSIHKYLNHIIKHRKYHYCLYNHPKLPYNFRFSKFMK